MSKKKSKNTEQTTAGKLNMELKRIDPLTANQAKVFESYEKGKNLLLHGYAGTGKSYISLYLAMKELLTEGNNYDRIIIIRSVVPSRDMGFLPGSAIEKGKIYEEPYKEMCNDLFRRGDAYDILKMKHLIEFTTTSFLRGLTFNNSIILVDEIQNMCWNECNTVMTRVGLNSKIIFSGDIRQTDLKRNEEKNGVMHFINILREIPSFDSYEFGENDIVRSGVVRDYIIKSTRYLERKDLIL